MCEDLHVERSFMKCEGFRVFMLSRLWLASSPQTNPMATWSLSLCLDPTDSRRQPEIANRDKPCRVAQDGLPRTHSNVGIAWLLSESALRQLLRADVRLWMLDSSGRFSADQSVWWLSAVDPKQKFKPRK